MASEFLVSSHSQDSYFHSLYHQVPSELFEHDGWLNYKNLSIPLMLPLKFLFAKLKMPLKLLAYNYYSSHLLFSLQILAHEAR